MTRRTHCGGCSAELGSAVVLDLGKTPLADAFPEVASEPEIFYPLQVTACETCGLVQLTYVVGDDVLYGADYAFYARTSPTLRAYHERYADWVLTQYRSLAQQLTVEIACNDGGLLEHLSAAGCRTVGVDPATGPVNVARRAGLTVYGSNFDFELARQLRSDHGPAGVIIANNVLGHVADLGNVIAGIRHLLADDGVAIVEFQYLPDLLAGNYWDHVYHEHRSYLSLSSLTYPLFLHGLSIVDLLRTPMQGGSVRLTLMRHADQVELPNEHHIPAMLGGLQSRVDYCAGRLLDMVSELDGRCAGYGATAKSATLLNYAQVGPRELPYIVDTTPHKIGRFTPGTHIPVVAPADRPHPDVYLLLAWNYLGDVLRREHAYVESGGRFLVPLPLPALV